MSPWYLETRYHNSNLSILYSTDLGAMDIAKNNIDKQKCTKITLQAKVEIGNQKIVENKKGRETSS